MITSPELAVRAVLEYNAGSYRGRRNIDIDREAYARFAGGVPEYEDTLIALLAFAADDYGGAQGPVPDPITPDQTLHGTR